MEISTIALFAPQNLKNLIICQEFFIVEIACVKDASDNQ